VWSLIRVKRETILLPREGALLAIDPGERRVGLAVCDPRQVVARPLATAPRPLRLLIPMIEKMILENEVLGLIVGHPLREDGTRGKQAQRAETLAFHLRQRFPQIPLLLWDERHSTRVAGDRLLTAPRPDQSLGLDAAAAAVILQSFLDSRG
jgi:putative Holliday junction resolvase